MILAGIGTAIVGWWAAKKVAFLLWGAVVLAVIAFCFGLVQWGRNMEAAKCDVAAKQAIIDTLSSDLQLAQARAERAEKVLLDLEAMRQASDKRIAALTEELEHAQRQSTAPNAEPNPNALLDDQCNYTDRGARRVRE